MVSTPMVTLALTGATSSLTANDQQNEFPSSPEQRSSDSTPFRSLYVLSVPSPMSISRQNNLQIYPNSSVAQPDLYAGEDGYR